MEPKVKSEPNDTKNFPKQTGVVKTEPKPKAPAPKPCTNRAKSVVNRKPPNRMPNNRNSYPPYVPDIYGCGPYGPSRYNNYANAPYREDRWSRNNSYGWYGNDGYGGGNWNRNDSYAGGNCYGNDNYGGGNGYGYDNYAGGNGYGYDNYSGGNWYGDGNYAGGNGYGYDNYAGGNGYGYDNYAGGNCYGDNTYAGGNCLSKTQLKKKQKRELAELNSSSSAKKVKKPQKPKKDKTPEKTSPPAKKGKKSKHKHEKKSRKKNPPAKTVETPPNQKQDQDQELSSDSSYSDDEDLISSGTHKCSAISIFNKLSYYDAIKTFEVPKKDSEQSYIKSELEEVKMSPYEVQMNNIYNDKIFELMARNDLLKSSLSPNTQRSDSSIVENPCAVKGYIWEKDVDIPAIRIVDDRIRETTASYLSNPNVCKRVLIRLIADLNDAVKFEGFTNQWNWYGSYLSGSACRDSTINLYYELVPESTDVGTIECGTVFKKLCQDSLKKCEAFSDLESNERRPFPWIRAYHPKVGRKINITFSNDSHSGELKVQNSYLMKLYFNMNPNLKDLTIFLKIIMQKYDIHGNRGLGRMNTFTLFWLVAFFMQQKKLLPAVIEVRKAAKIIYHVNEWDCSMPEEFSFPTEPISLYSLLLGFFDFYRDFDFSKYLVCPYLGSAVLLSDFERLLIPSNEFSTYLRLMQNSWKLTFRRSVINLQDPSDLSFNTAAGILDECANKFKVVCHRLSDLLPRSVEQIEKMDCFCNLLPNKMPMDFCDYFPHNLTQYHTIVLHTNAAADLGFDDQRQKKLNQIYILEAVRKIMEFVFKLEKKKIVIAQNVSQVVFSISKGSTVKRTYPVIYFEYCSSANTWQCDYMKEIIPRNADEKKPLTVNLTCDVCLETGVVKLFVQSDVDFIKFLRLYLRKLVIYTLSVIVPP
ncbi:uncharacterized protein LOC135839242 [Planococcus citri]|uniref:uncharacterized protein LOC135839242 n=1 Tax=Planococcus citri TaxID=170843 RepID=UPI0031F7D660